MSRPHGIKLENVTAAIDASEGYRILIRVVSVNIDDKPTLPVRELWARFDKKDSKLEYAVFNGNSVYDSAIETEVSLDEVNNAMHFTSSASWLPHHGPMSRPVDSGGWLVTEIVRTEPSIWIEDAPSTSADATQVIHEENLIKWLATDDEDGPDCDWDEDDWVGPDPVDSIPSEELNSDEGDDSNAENDESEEEDSISGDDSGEPVEEGFWRRHYEHTSDSEPEDELNGSEKGSDEVSQESIRHEEEAAGVADQVCQGNTQSLTKNP